MFVIEKAIKFLITIYPFEFSVKSKFSLSKFKGIFYEETFPT